MTDTIGAPSGADVSSASSSAPTASAGHPSRSSITQQLKGKRAETAKTEPASPVDATQTTDALGAADPGKKPEGDTALEAGKVDNKTNEKQEPDGDPPWLKERLGRAKKHQEKLETDLTAARTSEAKLRTVLEATFAENERLAEALQNGTAYNEQSEELHSLKLHAQVKEQLGQVEAKLRQEFEAERSEQQVTSLVGQLRAEVNAACEAFPLVSPAEVRAALRSNPEADVRSLAQAKHQERMAYISKQGGQRAVDSNLPTTVAKPTGVSRFEAPMGAKGMAQAFKHARAKG